jgi:hypothetical protein
MILKTYYKCSHSVDGKAPAIKNHGMLQCPICGICGVAGYIMRCDICGVEFKAKRGAGKRKYCDKCRIVVEQEQFNKFVANRPVSKKVNKRSGTQASWRMPERYPDCIRYEYCLWNRVKEIARGCAGCSGYEKASLDPCDFVWGEERYDREALG